jgi:hypothetical protein
MCIHLLFLCQKFYRLLNFIYYLFLTFMFYRNLFGICIIFEIYLDISGLFLNFFHHLLLLLGRLHIVTFWILQYLFILIL